MAIQPIAFERCSDLAEPLCAEPAPVWELVASIPAPRCDHRQHEDPALPQQVMIDTRIVLADFFGRMGKVEFHRPTATRLEVDEQQPVLRGEHVARVRLAVQQLLELAARDEARASAASAANTSQFRDEYVQLTGSLGLSNGRPIWSSCRSTI